jgi:anti-sigma regulatory factor (Ser/Thr protein kinase)
MGSTIDHFNATTMLEFIDDVMNKQRITKCKKIYFNFSTLVVIEPIGVVVLSNLIDYFDKINVDVVFEGFDIHSDANFFLDQSGFFKHHLKEKYQLKKKYIQKRFKSNHKHFSFKSPQLVPSDDAIAYLYFDLMPWIEREVDLLEDSLAPLRSAIEEIFHNIQDHSGEKRGYVFAQYAKNRNEIEIVISDFGVGIPKLVKTKLPAIDLDSDALHKACEEGFSTQSNVRNRGAGLPNLMRYITLRNNGTVLIISGKAQVVARKNKRSIFTPNIKATKHNGTYPGTLVKVVLRTDTLKQLAEDTKEEVFEW